jgi:hypothetical protein
MARGWVDPTLSVEGLNVLPCLLHLPALRFVFSQLPVQTQPELCYSIYMISQKFEEEKISVKLKGICSMMYNM